MATALFSKEGKFRAIITEVPSGIDDGYAYKVDLTKRIFKTQSGAINNARALLKKKRARYYKKHPEKRVRIKARRLFPKEKSNRKVIHKLYKMNKEAAKILVRMSDNKLKMHLDYSRKKWENKKTTAVSGNTADFNKAIWTTMKDGTKKERKIVAKMLKAFTNEPFRKTNMFY